MVWPSKSQKHLIFNQFMTAKQIDTKMIRRYVWLISIFGIFHINKMRNSFSVYFINLFNPSSQFSAIDMIMLRRFIVLMKIAISCFYGDRKAIILKLFKEIAFKSIQKPFQYCKLVSRKVSNNWNSKLFIYVSKAF